MFFLHIFTACSVVDPMSFVCARYYFWSVAGGMQLLRLQHDVFRDVFGIM